MVNRMDTTLLLPDLANQYATASHSVSLRLLAYACLLYTSDAADE